VLDSISTFLGFLLCLVTKSLTDEGHFLQLLKRL
jgi:hypothetical protein